MQAHGLPPTRRRRALQWNEEATKPPCAVRAHATKRLPTPEESIARALTLWKARPGGLRAHGGVITSLSNTFVPVRPTIRLLPVPGPGVEIYGTPEAHVLGSFSYDGRLVADDVAEWEARNVLSLRSYFADNWTKQVNVHLIDDNVRPDRYGNTAQVIRWRTTMDGSVL